MHTYVHASYTLSVDCFIILLYFILHCIGHKSILCYMSQSIMNLKVDLYMCGHVCDFVRVLIKYM